MLSVYFDEFPHFDSIFKLVNPSPNFVPCEHFSLCAFLWEFFNSGQSSCGLFSVGIFPGTSSVTEECPLEKNSQWNLPLLNNYRKNAPNESQLTRKNNHRENTHMGKYPRKKNIYMKAHTGRTHRCTILKSDTKIR